MASKNTLFFSLLALLALAHAPYGYSDIINYKAVIIDELYEDALNVTCDINGRSLGLVTLRQSKLYEPTITVDTSKPDDVVLTCNLNAGDRCGQFILFGYKRDGRRCEGRRCTWNVEEDALYLFLDNKQVLIYLWSFSGCR